MGTILLSQIYSMLIHVRSVSASLFGFRITSSHIYKSNVNVSIRIVHLIIKLKREFPNSNQPKRTISFMCKNLILCFKMACILAKKAHGHYKQFTFSLIFLANFQAFLRTRYIDMQITNFEAFDFSEEKYLYKFSRHASGIYFVRKITLFKWRMLKNSSLGKKGS